MRMKEVPWFTWVTAGKESRRWDLALLTHLIGQLFLYTTSLFVLAAAARTTDLHAWIWSTRRRLHNLIKRARTISIFWWTTSHDARVIILLRSDVLTLRLSPSGLRPSELAGRQFRTCCVVFEPAWCSPIKWVKPFPFRPSNDRYMHVLSSYKLQHGSFTFHHLSR